MDYQGKIDNELWINIASYLNTRDVSRLALTNVRWKTLFLSRVVREVSDSFLKNLTDTEDAFDGENFVSRYLTVLV